MNNRYISKFMGMNVIGVLISRNFNKNMGTCVSGGKNIALVQ